MEKQPNPDCESMTTVTVKDYAPSGMEYPDPPPSYRGVNKQHPMVQVAKIIAVTAVVIAAMLSVAIVFSAWLTSRDTVCQFEQTGGIETILEPQSLRSALLVGTSDLDSTESKIEPSTNKPVNSNDNKSSNKKEASTEEDDDDESDEDDSVTMLKLPLELNLQEHMFEKLNHRSHMNCVIEKKKAEEIVDEQSKPLPSFLGINMTTDPRYLHFTGEKMIVSCGGDDPNKPRGMLSQQDSASSQLPMMPMPHPQEQMLHPVLLDIIHGPPPAPMLFPPPRQGIFGPQQQSRVSHPFQPINQIPFQRGTRFPPPSVQPSNNNNIQMIGPIPFTGQQNPLEILLQHVVAEAQADPMLSASHISITGGNPNIDRDDSTPRLVPIFGPNNDLSDEITTGPIFFSGPPQQQQQDLPQSPQGRSVQFQLPGTFLGQSDEQDDSMEQQQGPARQIISELLQRERALPQPVPIQPRHHIQHVIRPRSTDAVAEKKSRVKRCACDCACKNHNPLKE